MVEGIDDYVFHKVDNNNFVQNVKKVQRNTAISVTRQQFSHQV